MRYFLIISSFLAFCSVNLWAMKTDFDPKAHIVSREGWGAKPAAKEGLEKHEQYGTKRAVNILFGHTVTDEGDSRKTLQAIQMKCMTSGSSDAPYNCCFDTDGICYVVRDDDVVPAVLPLKEADLADPKLPDYRRGSNRGSFAIGLIGRFDDHKDARKITDETVRRWGMHLGAIAVRNGFSNLKHKENVYGMSDVSKKYPVSPGIGFMKRLPEIIKVANQWIHDHVTPEADI